MEMININWLPREILTEILGFLPPADLKSAVLVSKRWRDMGEHPSIWTSCHVGVSSMADLDKLVSTRRLGRITTTNIRFWDIYSGWNSWNAFFQEVTTQPQLVKRLPQMKILGLRFKDLRSVEPDLLASFVRTREEMVFHLNSFSNDQLTAIFTNIASDQKGLKLRKLSMLFDWVVLVEPCLLSGALIRLVEVSLGTLTAEQALAVFKAVGGGGSSVRILEVDDYSCDGIDHVIFARALKTLVKFSARSTDLTSKQTQAVLEDILRGSLLKKLDMFGADFSEVSPGAFSESVNKLEVFTVETLFNITSEHVEKLFQVMAKSTALKILDIDYNLDVSSVLPVVLATAIDNQEEIKFIDGLTSDQVKLVFKHITDGSKLKRLAISNTNLTTLDPEVLAVGVNKLEEVYLEECEKEVDQVVAVLEQLVKKTQLHTLVMTPSIRDMVPEELVGRALAQLEMGVGF